MNANLVFVAAKRILLMVPVVLLTLYAGDYTWFRLRMDRSNWGPAFGTVQFYLATRTKNGGEEIFYDQPQKETCARSLFPQLDYRPCWYVRKETIRVVR